MGIPNEYDHPDLIAVIQKVIDAADKRHIPAGCWFGKVEQQLRTIRQGSRFVVYSNDSSMLKDAMSAALGELRKG
jgi:2-keto-3-deoxy-L-rhamnonate aldolase RhmA